MTSVEQLIGDLLLRHNCVIVPSFGGFVAKQIPASIDFNKGTILPPSKALLFNKQLINNDGLLINEFAQQNKVSFNEATTEIEGKVQSWTKTLNSGGRIELDRVGNLYYDAERNICFEQDRFFNLLLESFGLGQVQFVPDAVVEEKEVIVAETKVIPIAVAQEKPELKVERPQQEIIAEQQTETTEPEIVLVPKKKSRVWRYVAAACILPIAFYSIWIPMKTDVLESGVLSINDFNPFYEAGEGSYSRQELIVRDENNSGETASLQEQIDELPEDVSVYSYKLDDAKYVPVELPVSENNDTPTTDGGDNTEQFNPEAMNFIVGCFGQEANATNLVAKLKAQGFDAYIVDVHNGLHRVSAGAAVSSEAYAMIKVKAEGQGYIGWTLK